MDDNWLSLIIHYHIPFSRSSKQFGGVWNAFVWNSYLLFLSLARLFWSTNDLENLLGGTSREIAIPFEKCQKTGEGVVTSTMCSAKSSVLSDTLTQTTSPICHQRLAMVTMVLRLLVSWSSNGTEDRKHMKTPFHESMRFNITSLGLDSHFYHKFSWV